MSVVASTLPGMAYFALTMVNGPAYDDSRPRREQRGWDEHAAFMDGLVDEGLVVLGGPIGDGQQVLVIWEATDEPRSAAAWLMTGVREPVGAPAHLWNANSCGALLKPLRNANQAAVNRWTPRSW